MKQATLFKPKLETLINPIEIDQIDLVSDYDAVSNFTGLDLAPSDLSICTSLMDNTTNPIEIGDIVRIQTSDYTSYFCCWISSFMDITDKIKDISL